MVRFVDSSVYYSYGELGWLIRDFSLNGTKIVACDCNWNISVCYYKFVTNGFMNI